MLTKCRRWILFGTISTTPLMRRLCIRAVLILSFQVKVLYLYSTTNNNCKFRVQVHATFWNLFCGMWRRVVW